MTRYLTDEGEYELLTLPGSALTISLAPANELRNSPQPEIRIWGNRRGMASLASILLWLRRNAWRREFLSVTALPFVHQEGAVALAIHITDGDATKDFPPFVLLDKHCQFEWPVSEDDLTRLAIRIHDLASEPGHEYDILPNDERGHAIVHFRLTDAEDWP